MSIYGSRDNESVVKKRPQTIDFYLKKYITNQGFYDKNPHFGFYIRIFTKPNPLRFGRIKCNSSGSDMGNLLTYYTKGLYYHKGTRSSAFYCGTYYNIFIRHIKYMNKFCMIQECYRIHF